MLDLGTGLRELGRTMPLDGSFRGSALVTHMHWDHVQGLPFFAPILAAGARLDVYGPPQESGTLEQAFHQFVRPPFFPVTVEQLYGQIAFHDATDTDIEIDGAKVRVRPVPHIGSNNGYRVDLGGFSVAYVADHQMPHDGSHRVTDAVLELCDGVDLLIHDAQYTPAEFADKNHWGHCTVDFALFVAQEAGARRLALFHHDPAHDDDDVDRLLAGARDAVERAGSSVNEVLAAYEGLTVSMGG
ncbi:MAG: MBL fold metallo-hydrolase [Acidimicrobiia bacterium]